MEVSYPAKRGAGERTRDFAEVMGEYAPADASVQSSRCAGCGVPFCQTGCPLHNNIPDWLQLTSEGRWEEAWRLSEATSALPEICGRICPQDRLCEGACVLEQSAWGGVTIGSVEKFLGDKAFENGWVQPIRPEVETGLTVGIVGAGPAGLAAADRLRRLGHGVTIYDRHDRPGGLLTYGIPGFKLDKAVVDRRVRRLADSGVTFIPDFEVGRDASLQELRARHDAVLIATGVYKARRLETDGRHTPGVLRALDYLIAANRAQFGDAPGEDADKLDANGRAVVVVGGGDTAMDCVRTAVRQGATSVVCLYRRDRENMPGSRREVAHAEEEGVRFEWLALPESILEDGTRPEKVRAVRMRLGAAFEGRRHPERVPGSAFDLPAEMVVEALGFEAEDLPTLFGAPELKVNPSGVVKIDRKTMMTSLEGVFAAGDIVRGASLVVWAVREGQDAAAGVHAWLQARAGAAAAAAMAAVA